MSQTEQAVEQGERWTAYMRLPEIAGAPRNPKRHAGREIRRSIDEFGLAELPTLDERTGRLVAGHGRLDQLTEARAAGDAPPRYVKVDDDGEWLVPVSRGWASADDTAAEAYLVASNHLTTKGGWDRDGLGGMLVDINAVDPALLLATGFTDADLADLLGADYGEPDHGGGGGGGGGSGGIVQPGDVWYLGPHRLRVADDDRDPALDTLLRSWQMDTGIRPERAHPDGSREPVDFTA